MIEPGRGREGAEIFGSGKKEGDRRSWDWWAFTWEGRGADEDGPRGEQADGLDVAEGKRVAGERGGAERKEREEAKERERESVKRIIN